MRVLSLLAAMLFSLAALPAVAQAPPDGTPMVVRGTVEKLDGQSLTVKPKEGPPVTIALAANFTVAGVAKRSLADIKPGDYVATNSIKAADGQLHAIAGTWLLLFGGSTMAASVLTVRLLAWLGALFMAFGAVALLLPTNTHNVLLGVAFGGLHLLFGSFLMGRAAHER